MRLNVSGRGFACPTTLRLQPAVLERIRVIAEREGSTEADVMRQAISLGLQEIKRQDGART